MVLIVVEVVHHQGADVIDSKLEYDDKLRKDICCPKCKSKSLEIIELFRGANTYTTNLDGEIISASMNVYQAIDPYKINIVCLTCNHFFRKKKVWLYSDIFENKA